jgi:hypothetical protein
MTAAEASAKISNPDRYRTRIDRMKKEYSGMRNPNTYALF